MSSAHFLLGAHDSTELIPRKPHQEPPEFDITAMVDLVFMMNIYFLVTFVTVSLTQVDLPAATHVAPLDADTSVVFTIEGGGDTKKPFTVYDGDRETGLPIHGAEQQEAAVKAAVEKGLAAGKTEVLLKAEKYVRLGDLFRVSTAASSVEGVKLNVAVMEKEQP